MRMFETVGRGTARAMDEVGFAASLLGQSVFWLTFGSRRRQPVRMHTIFAQMVQMGTGALPIATLLSATIGIMLAIQSIHTLRIFGAESFAYVGIGLSITREFSPLIMGILLAGRSGSAIAARLSTMTINQEVDALQVIGISPIRYLVAPSLVAMLIVLPALTMWANIMGLGAAGLFVSASLDLSFASFVSDTIRILKAGDILHGLGKSVLFAILIVLLGVLNGASVKGGAEGVGAATTRAVVQGIAAVILTDMLFAFMVTL
ncbi:MAG: MlaE family ABC transporter permease [Alphaproteobacteria bacterium]